MNIAILIPSLDPNERLGTLVSQLCEQGLTQIVVVDDGSAASAQPVFDLCASLGCVVVHHDCNRGKGEALRTGLRTARERFPTISGVVTADGDGQHLVKDIVRVAHALEATASGLILGTRDFSGKHVPFRSRFGNRFSSLFFRLSAGVSCPDTQTGLRGIPAALFDFALSVSGSRYEYEMNLLFCAAQQRIPLRYIPIETVYEDKNSVSHFRPLRDSARIYAAPLRFAIASLSSFFIDILLFSLFTFLLPSRTAQAILTATFGARVCSGIYNFLLNRRWSFSSTQESWHTQGIRYLILFLCQMLVSGSAVWLLSFLPLPLTLVKIFVDTILFCISYFIQHNWVFRK